jgi:RNA polymerase sigma factor (sigma-70 family)
LKKGIALLHQDHQALFLTWLDKHGSSVVLVLLYLDEMSYPEMAEVLGISESNVGVKLNRAKKALSELMKDQSHES